MNKASVLLKTIDGAAAITQPVPNIQQRLKETGYKLTSSTNGVLSFDKKDGKAVITPNGDGTKKVYLLDNLTKHEIEFIVPDNKDVKYGFFDTILQGMSRYDWDKSVAIKNLADPKFLE